MEKIFYVDARTGALRRNDEKNYFFNGNYLLYIINFLPKKE